LTNFKLTLKDPIKASRGVLRDWQKSATQVMKETRHEEKEFENSYPKILKKTQGTWEKENWQCLRKKRKQIELKGFVKRK